jgi:hypothetical protein
VAGKGQLPDHRTHEQHERQHGDKLHGGLAALAAEAGEGASGHAGTVARRG